MGGGGEGEWVNVTLSCAKSPVMHRHYVCYNYFQLFRLNQPLCLKCPSLGAECYSAVALIFFSYFFFLNWREGMLGSLWDSPLGGPQGKWYHYTFISSHFHYFSLQEVTRKAKKKKKKWLFSKWSSGSALFPVRPGSAIVHAVSLRLLRWVFFFFF